MESERITGLIGLYIIFRTVANFVDLYFVLKWMRIYYGEAKLDI